MTSIPWQPLSSGIVQALDAAGVGAAAVPLTTSGTIDATGSALTISLYDVSSISVMPSGVWNGTIVVQSTLDFQNWITLNTVDITPSNQPAIINSIGYTGGFRVIATNWVSGSANVLIQ